MYTYTYTYYDVGQFRLQISVYVRVHGEHPMCGPVILYRSNVTCRCRRCIHIYLRGWYMVRIAMYFGNVWDWHVRENTIAVRLGGNYCILTARSKVRRERLRETAKFCNYSKRNFVRETFANAIARDITSSAYISSERMRLNESSKLHAIECL